MIITHYIRKQWSSEGKRIFLRIQGIDILSKYKLIMIKGCKAD